MKAKDLRQKSEIHRKVLGVIKKAYPDFHVVEEFQIKVQYSGREMMLLCDMVVPDLKLAVECHGRQHFEFVPHFHGTEEGFTEQKNRDRAKQEALEANGYIFLAIRYDNYELLTPKKLNAMVMKLYRRNKHERV